jgi:hypothetical protein
MPRVRCTDLERREHEKHAAAPDEDELFLLVTLTPEEGRDLQELAARYGTSPQKTMRLGLALLSRITRERGGR